MAGGDKPTPWLIMAAIVAASSRAVLAQMPCEPQLDLAFWDSGLGGGGVDQLVVFDDGQGCGPALYAGGKQCSTSCPDFLGLTKWNGRYWQDIDGFVGEANDFVVHDDGSGPALFVGGMFMAGCGEGPAGPNIAKWNGTEWQSVGPGIGCDWCNEFCFSSDVVIAMAVYDTGLGDGPMLYAGGVFDDVGGDNTIRDIAMWDGQSWSHVGGGVQSIGDEIIFSMAVHDDGTGPSLYVTGAFDRAGNVPALGIARWNGAVWSPVGGGLNGEAYALAVFDEDGDGPLAPALFAGGEFTMAGGVTANHVAKWNGAAWQEVGGGVSGSPASFSPPQVWALERIQ